MIVNVQINLDLLMQAIDLKNNEFMSTLLKQEDSVENVTQVLCHVCENRDYELVKTALQSITCSIQDIDKTAHLLYEACYKGYWNIAELLLEYGVLVNQQYKYGWHSLLIASNHGHAEVVKILLQYDALVDLQNTNGWSALMIACQKNFTNIAEILLVHRAQVNLQNKDGWSALMIAGQKNHADMVKLLLENGAQVDLQSLCLNCCLSEWPHQNSNYAT